MNEATRIAERSEAATCLSAIAGLLLKAQRILAMCHIAPDGDAIGSLLGLGWLLRSLPAVPGVDGAGETDPLQSGRIVVSACAEAVPLQLRFLPGAGEITSDPPRLAWDVVVTLDASDTRRLGSVFRPAEHGTAPIVNLDHHVTNLNFGTLNCVDTSAAATAQIVMDLADALGVPITREAAVCLLTGLVTDTLGFRTSNVTPAVLRATERLMEAGANLYEVTERTLNYKPFSMLRLWGLALCELRCAEPAATPQGQVVWTFITQDMRARVGAPESGDGGLASFLLNSPEAGITAVFSETTDGKVEVSFRARPGLDVSAVAFDLGGGGHPQAAGCTVVGSIATAEAQVLPLLQRAASEDQCRE